MIYWFSLLAVAAKTAKSLLEPTLLNKSTFYLLQQERFYTEMASAD